MFNRQLIGLALLSSFLMGTAIAETDGKEAPAFKIGIYKNSGCKGKPDATFDIYPARSCNSYSYTDSKGVLFSGSQNNFRCSKDKVTYDKYPFSANCSAKESVFEGKQIVNRDHTLNANQCHEAPSHEGPVYEKLVDYKYTGNENCLEK
jgi:hypothetical protein